jgi:hypothetical protein
LRILIVNVASSLSSTQEMISRVQITETNVRVVEIINTMHRFAPLLYSIFWLLHDWQ